MHCDRSKKKSVETAAEQVITDLEEGLEFAEPVSPEVVVDFVVLTPEQW